MTVTAMTAAAFKNWLDGYMEGRGGRLTQKDIKRIQAQAASGSEGCGCYHSYPYVPQWPYSPWSWGTTTITPTIFTGTVSNQDSTDFTPGVYVSQTPVLPPDTYSYGSTGNVESTSMCSG